MATRRKPAVPTRPVKAPRLDDDITKDVREWSIDPDDLPLNRNTDYLGQYFMPILPVVGKADIFVEPDQGRMPDDRADWLINFLRYQRRRSTGPAMSGREAVDYYGNPDNWDDRGTESTRQHELGHHLWFTRMTGDQRRQWESIHERTLPPNMRSGHYSRSRESFPELYAMFQTDPERLLHQSPAAYKYIAALVGAGWNPQEVAAAQEARSGQTRNAIRIPVGARKAKKAKKRVE